MGIYCSAGQIILNPKDLPIVFQAFVVKLFYSDVWISAHYLKSLLTKITITELATLLICHVLCWHQRRAGKKYTFGAKLTLT